MTRDPAGERPNVVRLSSVPHAQVLIIGGGINGIGIFRDLALQGVDVALVERGDFASGASSASSHMIHGGVRYLENGEFRLVREAVHERNALLKIAGHYVKPLRTTIPIFSTFSGILAAPLRFLTHRQTKTVERGALLIKLGLTIYDSFSRDGGTIPRHVFRGAKTALRELPQLNPAVKYAATYYDASVHNPERLALDVLQDGLQAPGPARAANYVAAVGVEDGAVQLRDLVTGKQFAFHADVIVNACGPWTDLTNRILGRTTRFMGGTKGSHIVLDSPELLAACAGRELFFENSDGRIVLIYPLRGKVMVGTTDLEADIESSVRCTDEEVSYFFDLIGHVFPGIPVDESQIVYRFAGVRPLPAHGDTQPGFVSRDYRIESDHPENLPDVTVISLIGGKWTTFRAVAEHMTDTVLGFLKMPRRLETGGLPIGGGRDFPVGEAAHRRWIAQHRAGLPLDRAEQLLGRYGTRATAVIDFVTRTGDDPLESTSDFTVQELRFMAENEYVVHVLDVLLRRASSAFDGTVTSAVIQETARILGEILGWSAQQTSEEVEEAARVLREEHGVDLGRATVPATRG